MAQDPEVDLPSVAKQLQEQALSSIPAIAEGFRIGYVPSLQCCALLTFNRVTEEPFKIPYYAALLRLLYDRPVSEEDTTPLGRLVLDEFWKAFREFLEKDAWRETRLCVHIIQFLPSHVALTIDCRYNSLPT